MVVALPAAVALCSAVLGKAQETDPQPAGMALRLAAAAVALCSLQTTALAATPAKATLDPARLGLRFDGVGGVSGGGGGTRLLLDYDEQARGEILDYL